MAATIYPVRADLTASLAEIPGAPTVSNDTLDAALETAIDQVEQGTRRVFTSTGNAETRTFPGFGTYGKDAIVEIPDCHTITEVLVDDVELTEGTDYILLPRNLRTNRPVEAIKFIGNYVPYDEDSLSITAKFGWAALPAAIKLAILNIGKGIILGANSAGTGNVESRKIGDRAISYGTHSSGRNEQSLLDDAQSTIEDYMRLPYV